MARARKKVVKKKTRTYSIPTETSEKRSLLKNEIDEINKKIESGELQLTVLRKSRRFSSAFVKK